LTHQPNAILERLNSGSYVNSNTHLPPIINHRKSKTASRSLFTFLNVESASTDVQRSKLNNFLIGHSGDFMHVLSLKGLFQYVSPSVRDTLEYEPEDLVGRSISDICHPADLTPLIRDLKDTSLAMPGGSDNTFGCVLKTTSLLYRARTKSGSYVWIEAHGRLHIETGKGRKSVILSGRRRSFSLLSWRSIDAAGGLSEREFWALLSPHGHWLSVPDKVNTLLKRKPEDLRGKLIQDMLPMPIQRTQVHMTLRQIVAPSQPGSQQHPSAIRVQAELQGKENRFHCQLIFYAQGSTSEEETILCQVKVGDIVTLMDAQFASTSSQMGFAQPIITTPPPLAYSGARDSDSNSDDVLKELSHTNHTSWQYELTSLRMANENLAREIGELESKLGLLPSLRSLNLATSVSPSTGTALTSKPKTKKRRRDVDSPE
jgi:PAS domain S-box-containing protein